MNDYMNEELWLDCINDEELTDTGDTMNMNTTNPYTMIAYRDMSAIAARTEINHLTYLARHEHVLFDGITASMSKGEYSGVVKDFSLRKLWRWERIKPSNLHTIEITNGDEDYTFDANVIFPWGEIVHSHYYDGEIVLDDWQQLIIDAIEKGATSGAFTDDNLNVWHWTKA